MTLNKIFSWTVAILWMTLIFYLSHQPATESSELSAGITEMIKQIIERIAFTVDFESFHSFIRKGAHFFAYFVLGFLVINALRISGVTGNRSITLALVICVLYAISDEVHQMVIPGRSGEIRDVIIDSAGASVGIGLYMLIGKVVGKKKDGEVHGDSSRKFPESPE